MIKSDPKTVSKHNKHLWPISIEKLLAGPENSVLRSVVAGNYSNLI